MTGQLLAPCCDDCGTSFTIAEADVEEVDSVICPRCASDIDISADPADQDE